MTINHVHYKNFRNIVDDILGLDGGLNILYGENAQGKTNALEGIYLSSSGRSHRTPRERDFIRHGEEFSSITVEFSNLRRINRLDLRYLKNGKKNCALNTVPIARMSEFVGNLQAVFFYPEHLDIVRGGPGERRNFLDGAISQLDRAYMTTLREYYATLEQRNKLMATSYRNPEAFESTIDVWNEQLATHAAVISQKRTAYVEKLLGNLVEILLEMSGGQERIHVEYEGLPNKEAYLEQFTKNLEREQRAGVTLFGIHREDFEITLFPRSKNESYSARRFASQGQQRSVAIALKLAEGQICCEMSGESPVYLLDDVMSELDSNRRGYMLKGIEGAQVIVTCSDAEFALLKQQGHLANAKCVSVEGGVFG